ncbi:hypothetical protein P19250A_0013 [Methylophilaceae phage P19250A]|nr:hypothetical protein P19250A_0013 [Methylophilaceae phage P19250A]
MSKLGSALGKKYEENRLSVLTRTFELGNHTFKVRVPSVQEIEAIYNYFKNPNQEKIEEEYQLMAKAFENFEGKEGIEVKDNDFIIDGRSVRETATNKHVLQYRIVEYIKFLIPETGSLEDITYEDVEAEFPLSVQMTLVEKINEVISPDYKDIKSK